MLSNHDETRHDTRYGRADTGPQALFRDRPTADLALGARRARAAAVTAARTARSSA
ncbi:hypothetical protein [Streptomyces sp. HUAS ZL42]|uniref:hypothetical protein n=1 Tax=Streptomyces sp. HUAS ZL42 TaxID=3231715 RepID=UPI00345E4CC0